MLKDGLISRMVFCCIKQIFLLPEHIWHKFGRCFGVLLFVIMRKRKHVIKRNIELCFAEKSISVQQKLQNQNAQELGLGALEFFACCFRPKEYAVNSVELIGLDLLKRAESEGKGVIIILPHVSTMCIAISALSQLLSINLVHRPFKHNNLRALLQDLTTKLNIKLIAQRDVKSIIYALKNNENLVILPDHDMGSVGTIFADFFGIKAATTVSAFKLAKSTGAKIITAYSYRSESGKICIEFGDKLQLSCNSGYSESAVALNTWLEANVERFPGQYYWPHRRFKTRPNKEESLY